ncbi:hypothetical protein [Aliivibrio sp. SR45-2]|uniref:hypothetical protein n=1 Tax=Aliivibrio sp. SR45-2 TaxID=2760931 RepID=UPI0015FB7A3D|nr:hypothetical protein [Aliivibrio sp. SR45-2]MBB1314735.1 hypothetical protein [Aliivibrio sp. SR45-2]
MSRLYVIAVLLFLSGCADHINEKQGTRINVIPVVYSLSINSSDNDIIKEQISVFIQKYDIKNKNGHWELLIASNEITIQEGKYQQLLNKFGYTLNQIKTVERKGESHFSVTIAFATQRIEYEICDYEQIDYYGSTKIGCYTENNRWHSMVNPENAM